MAKIVLQKNSGTDFKCPHCGQEMTVERDMQGIAFDCPECGKSITCPLHGTATKNGGDDGDRILAEIARHGAETAKAVKEIRNLFAIIMVFWLGLIVLGVLFASLGM